MSSRIRLPTRVGSKYIIECAVCHTKGELSISTDSLPPEMIRRKFLQRGWEFGKDARFDLCPVCNGKRLPDPEKDHVTFVGSRSARRRMKSQLVHGTLPRENLAHTYLSPGLLEGVAQAIVPGVTVGGPNHMILPIPSEELPMPTDQNQTDVVVPIKADPPRQMTRGDRQVIWNKLQDVYPKEDKGYMGEWTDGRVAKDLGVPRAWVTEIRAQNFGPEVVTPVIPDIPAAAHARHTAAIVRQHEVLKVALAAVESATIEAQTAARVLRKLIESTP